jgi:hypothetical protein
MGLLTTFIFKLNSDHAAAIVLQCSDNYCFVFKTHLSQCWNLKGLTAATLNGDGSHCIHIFKLIVQSFLCSNMERLFTLSILS